MKRRAAQKNKRLGRKRVYRLKVIARSAGIFMLFFASALTLVGVFAYKNLTKNFTSAISNAELISGKSDILKEGLTTVLYVSVEDITVSPVHITNIIVLFLDKDSKKVVSYSVSPVTVVDIPGKFGEEELAKVIALGSLDASSDEESLLGITLLKKTLVKLFGIGIDKYILVDKSLDADFTAFFTHASVKSETLKKFRETIQTDLNVKELYEIYKFVDALPEDRLVSMNFSTTAALDEDIRDITFDSKVAEEKKSIAILNGAGVAGVAAFSSRVLENMGGRIVGVENAKTTYETGVLVVDDPQSETVKEIQEFFGFTNVEVKGQSDIDENALDRADITLIIGLDMGNSL